MVAKEGLPSLRGRAPPPRHILGDAGLADLDAELEKLTVHSLDAAKRAADRRPRLKEPFATFIKSVIRLSEAAKPKSPTAHKLVLRTARYLHDQLEHRD